MSMLYIFLAIFRVLSSVFIQNGYVHPDEFFQTTEIITGEYLCLRPLALVDSLNKFMFLCINFFVEHCFTKDYYVISKILSS